MPNEITHNPISNVGQDGTRQRMGRGHTYYVYILLCDDGSYYTGYSNNPEYRLVQHLKGRGARYTKMHKPSKIVYLQRHTSRRDAMIRERRIKTLSHQQKRELVEAAI